MNHNIRRKQILNEIGKTAQKMDAEMTILQRMKIKKRTLFRIVGAIGVYLVMMSIFSTFL